MLVKKTACRMAMGAKCKNHFTLAFLVWIRRRMDCLVGPFEVIFRHQPDTVKVFSAPFKTFDEMKIQAFVSKKGKGLMRPTDLIVDSVTNQHRNAIIALEAIISSLPNLNAVDPEMVKQNIRRSSIFGAQLPPGVYNAAEVIALNILSKT